ncbi:MAG: hypothetical protein IPJ65_11390 [Archangiaceae bacterium]|nr:hypothetical protein [Archangiaceae bacterium]
MRKLPPSALSGWLTQRRLDKTPAQLTRAEQEEAALALGVPVDAVAQAVTESNALAGAPALEAAVPVAEVYGATSSLDAGTVFAAMERLASALDPAPPDGRYAEGWERSYRLTAAALAHAERALAEHLPAVEGRAELLHSVEKLEHAAGEDEAAPERSHVALRAAAEELTNAATRLDGAQLPAELVMRELAAVARGSTRLSTEFDESVQFLAAADGYSAAALWDVTPDWGSLAREVAGFARAVGGAVVELEGALPPRQRAAVHEVGAALCAVEAESYGSVMSHVQVLAARLEAAAR